MKDEIKRALKPLIGEPLSDMWRFGGMQIFEFGTQYPRKNRKGQDITRADQRLHVSCYWCITGPEGGILSSDDFHPTRHDENARSFYDMIGNDPPLVEAVEADDGGGAVLQMVGGYALSILADEGNKDDTEHWRFLPKDKRRNHFVIYSTGIGK